MKNSSNGLSPVFVVPRISATFFVLGLENACAAGGDGSVLDLKWSFLNLVILLAFVVWKAKKPLSEIFDKNSRDVEYLYNVAQEKEKESRIKYEMYQKKMEWADEECEGILEKFHGRRTDFAKEHRKKGDIFVEKMKKERDSRVAVEKKRMLKEIEGTLMADIIFRVRRQIKENHDLKSRVTKGLLSKIG